ncbi:hypothetical protein C0989_007586 [Termitomyces sp. Mn162]|nr:hypothetical protein C0989_007586 [Termitomyces sp. Mn162]
MENRLQAMRDTLQDALDELSSARTPSEAKTRALHRIEQCLAAACISKDSSEELLKFNALQYTFQCNAERESLASKLSSQLALSLSLIQGVSLNHSASKAFLGRKYALEASSRHLPASTLPSVDIPSRTAASGAPPLSSVVIDTLLCILVDASTALRAFEDASGTQAVVKILKRAGTPREVRMKCMEFLYFYLLDENPTSSEGADILSLVPTSPPTAPATPSKPSKPYLNSKPLRPSSSRLASEFSFLSNKSSASTSSTPRSTSGSSSNSFSSTSSNVSSSTAPSSISSSPDKPSAIFTPKTPPRSPSLPHRLPHKLQPRSLMMLRKEVEYEPQSPKKVQLSRAGSGLSRQISTKRMSRLRVASEDDYCKFSQVPGTPSRQEQNRTTLEDEPSRPQGHTEKIRTTEEKKELLGTMLGNVDALVEGVRKAGIWGLG